MTRYEKACNKTYLEKYSKNGDILREAEQYPNGNWIVCEYLKSRINLQGEYTNEEFKKIKKYFKN